MDTKFREPPVSRRNALKSISSGFGYLAFAGIAAKAAAADQRSGALSPKQPHFAPKAKRVIFLCMNGAPSHVDLLDPKPALSKANGQTSPRGLTGFAKLMGSPWRFSARGKSGTEFSELLPNIGSHADELCVIRSMQTDLPAHGPASIQLHTGSTQFIRPSIGAWSLYGLGSEAENLPGFINLSAPIANGGAQKYGSAFLPAVFQGTPIGNLGPFGKVIGELKIENARNSRLSADQQRLQIDFIQSLNQQRLRADAVNPHIEGMIESLELGFRMQGEIPRLLDLTEEKPALLERYGVGIEPTDYMGRQCLLARRFAEAGVRFIEVNHGDWDDHRGIFQELPKHCSEIDKPVSALLTDLQERGLLQETLVIWGGEFGRTPHAQGNGRDHNAKGFSLWMAGGGIKGGITHGATDELGYEAVENPVHIHDWHATILHLLGLDHEKLTYRHAGRDFRLTDVKGRVIHDIIT
jgi:hypothetical protein